MAKQALLERLEELYQELLASKEADAGAIESLQQVSANLREVVEKQQSALAPEELGAAVREQLEALESEHPVVTRFLSQMTDFLALLGI